MVERDIKKRGIKDKRVLEAMEKIPRHKFVPDEYRQYAYGDFPLSIGYGQTISQPYIVAYMTDLLQLEPEDRVLEIGAGSGYQTAILAELSKEVYAVEIVPELLESARELLTSMGYSNIYYKQGDGKEGWEEKAPFSKIIVTAAPREIPDKLIHQLCSPGRMVIPVGALGSQTLYLVKKNKKEELDIIPKLSVAFVPLV